MNRDSKGGAITDRSPAAMQSPDSSNNNSTNPPTPNTNPTADAGPNETKATPPAQGKKDASNTSISNKKSLKDIAEDKLKDGNASQLGDPISLKAETSERNPTEEQGGVHPSSPEQIAAEERKGAQGASAGDSTQSASKGGTSQGASKGGASQGVKEGKQTMGQEKQKSLKEMAEENPSKLGDPVSLKAEDADSEPTEGDRGAMGEEERRKRGSKL